MKTIRMLFKIMPLTLLLSMPLYGRPLLGSKAHEAKTIEELHTITKDAKKIAIKVGADWCGACKVSEAPFHNAAKKHPDVKTVSIDADNKEFKKFLKTFHVEGLPTIIYVKKSDSSDTDYHDVAKMLGVTDKSTLIIARKEVGSRNEDEFSRALASLSGPTHHAVEKITAREVVVEKPVKKIRAKKERKTRRGRAARSEAAQEMADLGFPMADESLSN